MLTISSAEFSQDIDRFQNEAQRQPVRITKDGRAHTVLVSAHRYTVLTQQRVVGRSEDLDEATIEAIRNAEVPKHVKDF